MRVLFVHQNFPGQFLHLAPALVEAGHEVVALTLKHPEVNPWQGVQIVTYALTRGTVPGVHPWVAEIEPKIVRGEACLRAASRLRDAGFEPDVIVAHPGWGESLFLKDVWPRAKLGVFCEFFYAEQGADVAFDPEFPVSDPWDACRIRVKNLNNIMNLQAADAVISPTIWQASAYPAPYRDSIRVIHDGIDTQAVRPDPAVSLILNGTLTLTRADEVITFVNRNLEPYRGYHIFMRALPALLRRRPNAHVLIVGGEGVSYGAAPPNGRSWRDIFIEEVRPQIPDEDWVRVHFLGNIAYQHFVPLLQLSRVHVYWTYPFVLSWSLLEAMSAGCAIVASDTAPVREVITHDETGRLVDFFDINALTGAVCHLLERPADRERLGSAARQVVRNRYDLATVCLPAQIEWVELLGKSVKEKSI
jgi:glycosyltransferase involved in cell wall biosynthesis